MAEPGEPVTETVPSIFPASGSTTGNAWVTPSARITTVLHAQWPAAEIRT
jgi:hypothetical protein